MGVGGTDDGGLDWHEFERKSDMAESTKIEWADHTASPWHGCVEVHAGCDNCYARTMAKRNPGTLGVWGKDGTRIMSASFAKNCRRWNASAKKRGVIETVFPSICDPFEDWDGDIFDSQGRRLWIERSGEGGYVRELSTCSFSGMRPVTMADLRHDLFELIDKCQYLQFLLLTKRPENVRRMWLNAGPPNQATGDETSVGFEPTWFRPNVALITSVSDQATADAMIPELLKCRDLCPILGVSAEPLLGPVNLARVRRVLPSGGVVRGTVLEGPGYIGSIFRGERPLDWVIIGGESGYGARPYNLAWPRSIISQCRDAGVPVFHKQIGSNPTCGHDSGLNQSKISRILGSDARCLRCGFAYPKDSKGGGDMSEWPEDLRVREYPAWEPHRA